MFKKSISVVLVFAMLFSMVSFADAKEEASDYIEVVMDEEVKADYENMEGWGLAYTHVAFNEKLWGLSYYEMGFNQSIQNTHGLVESNIRSIDFGKGFTTEFFVPFKGNEQYNPLEIEYKTVKHGYWFPREHKVMVIKVSKRKEDDLLDAPAYTKRYQNKDVYVVNFEEPTYLSKGIHAVLVDENEIKYIVTKSGIELDLSSINTSFQHTLKLSVEGYKDLYITIPAYQEAEGEMLPPTPEKVSLKIIPNSASPFAGAVSFIEEDSAVENYINKINAVTVSGQPYQYVDIKSLVTAETLISLITSIKDTSTFVDAFNVLIESTKKEYAYYKSAELPDIKVIKGYWDEAKPLLVKAASLIQGLFKDYDIKNLILNYDWKDPNPLTNKKNLDLILETFHISDPEEGIAFAMPFIELAEDGKKLFDKIKLDYQNRKITLLGLTADGFNLPVNTTVLVKAEGYQDLTFTFDGVGNIVSYNSPELPIGNPSYEFVERDTLPDYIRLTFNNEISNEYEAADYIAKITNIKVNGAYYKKHSSLIFNTAYMLSKVYGDVFGYYVFVDMTVDGFTEGENTIEIIAEGYDNLIFTVEK